MCSLLETCSESYSNAAWKYKFSFSGLCITLVFHFIGLTTHGWSFSYGNQGLWKFCNTTMEYTCCAALSDHANAIGTTLPSFIGATIAFLIMGVIFAILGLIALFFIMFLVQSDAFCCDRRCLIICDIVLFAIAGFCLVIALSAYGGEYRYHDLTKGGALGYSFYMLMCPLFVYLFTAVALFCNL